MSLPELDNLVRIGQLKSEPANELEFKRLLKMAQSRLADARLASLSREGVSQAPITQRMRLLWRLFVGTVIEARIDSLFFNA